MNKTIIYIGGGLFAVIVIAILFFLFRPDATPSATTEGFGIGDNRSVSVNTDPTPTAEVFDVGGSISQQIIFKIADGPIAGATIIETTRPTTTVARYVKQENGHVFDQPLDVPGAVARSISNTTIPGVRRAVWVSGGSGVILQYLSDGITKSVYLGFPAATTTATSTRPNKIQFLPDNIVDIAASSNGSQIAYLLRTASGVTGYTANTDGSASAQLFTLPLSQVTLSWPAQGALLAVSKSSAGVPGVAYSIALSSGRVMPLLHAAGLTASADRSFARVIFQTTPIGATAPTTYSRNVAAGVDTALSFDPYPEKCLWSAVATTTLYCAAPLEYVPANYLDLWHLGAASVPDSVFSFDIAAGETTVVAIPGSQDGGEPSDILEMSLSPDEDYLSFIARGTRALWGVRAQ